MSSWVVQGNLQGQIPMALVAASAPVTNHSEMEDC